MSDLPTARLFVAGACLLSGSFVLGAETCVSALSEARLRALLDEIGPQRGRHLVRYLADPDRVLSRLLAYRITSIIVAAVLATDALVRTGDRVPKLVAIVAALTFLYALLAEVFTSIARARAWQLAPRALAVTLPLEWLMAPLAAPLAWLGRRIRRGDTRPVPAPAVVTNREMEYLVEEAEETGAIDAKRGEMMQRVLALKDRTARDVMVPRTKMNAIEGTTPIETAVSVLTEEGHSRVPVYRGQVDNIVGVLHVKDLFRVAMAQRADALAGGTAAPPAAAQPVSKTVEDVARRPPLFVAHNQSALAVLREMQSKRKHLAVVLDEFGSVIGLVAMEDVIEELVGDIQDEHDTEDATFVDQGNGRYVASAGIAIAELGEQLGTEFPEPDLYASLGGFLADRLSAVPTVGREVEWNGFRFVVREGDERRATTVEITRTRAPDVPPQTASQE